MPAGQERDKGLIDDLLLAENDLADALADAAQPFAERLDLCNHAIGGVVGGGGGRVHCHV